MQKQVTESTPWCILLKPIKACAVFHIHKKKKYPCRGTVIPELTPSTSCGEASSACSLPPVLAHTFKI
jgi:hypothetical protein